MDVLPSDSDTVLDTVSDVVSVSGLLPVSGPVPHTDTQPPSDTASINLPPADDPPANQPPANQSLVGHPLATLLQDLQTARLPRLVRHPTIPDLFDTPDVIFNRPSYRYDTAIPSPLCPLHAALRVPPLPHTCHIAWHDRSPFTALSADARTLSTDKGWRSARVDLPLRQGVWYFEVDVLKGGGRQAGEGPLRPDYTTDGAHVRIGVGRREANLNAPVGYDAYSYAVRDRDARAVHLSRPSSSDDSPPRAAIQSGQTIGVCVRQPPVRVADPNDPLDPNRIQRKRIPFHHKGQMYFESAEFQQAKEMINLRRPPTLAEPAGPAPPPALRPGEKRVNQPLPPPPDRPIPYLPDSRLTFTRDGEYLDHFDDLLDWAPLHPHPPDGPYRSDVDLRSRTVYTDDGSLGYYPMLSVYAGGTLRFNPGPDFKFPPPDPEARPLSERYDEYRRECAEADKEDEAAKAAEVAALPEAVRNQSLLLLRPDLLGLNPAAAGGDDLATTSEGEVSSLPPSSRSSSAQPVSRKGRPSGAAAAAASKKRKRKQAVSSPMQRSPSMSDGLTEDGLLLEVPPGSFAAKSLAAPSPLSTSYIPLVPDVDMGLSAPGDANALEGPLQEATLQSSQPAEGATIIIA